MPSFFQKMWHGETRGLTSAAFLVGGASLLSSLLGVVRDRLLASSFGAGMELDAYYAAFRLPDLLFYLVIVGAFTAGFIPLFSEYAERGGKEAAARFTSQVLSWVGLAMVILSCLLAVFVPWLILAMVHGFSAPAEQLTVHLTWIMLLSPILMGLSAVMGGVLQATQRFFTYACAPILYNLGILFGILVLAPHIGIFGVAWGVVLGAALHLLAQWSVARRAGFGHLVRPSFAAHSVGKLVKMTTPRLMSLAVSQINLMVLVSLASTLPLGAVTVFNLSNNIQSFPLSIFGISFALAAFPALSQAASRHDEAAFSRTLMDAGQKIIFFMLPATALMVVLRVPIVEVILRGGKFTFADVGRTADLVGWLAVSLVAQSLVPLLNRASFALQEVWKPFWITLLAEGVNLGLAYWLRSSFGITGLAIAFTVAFWINAGLLWFVLRRKRVDVANKEFWRSSGKTIFATVALAIAAAFVKQWIANHQLFPSFWQSAFEVVGSSVAGVVAFLIVARACRSEEMGKFWSGIKHRLLRTS